MDYSYIPKQLIYRKKNLDVFARQHPLNAAIIRRLMKLERWEESNPDYVITPCLNTAYYICTIMRMEFDATMRINSYKSIARQGSEVGHNTFVQCVTLSIVVFLIEHSTPEWKNKLQEIANLLRDYAQGLKEERIRTIQGLDIKETEITALTGMPEFVSKCTDESLILPDEMFHPRKIDDSVIYDMKRNDPTFNWDKWLYHHREEEMYDLVESLGKTQEEKALLIYYIWYDIYSARKRLELPIKSTWIFLNSLAQEFCPDCMEKTQLSKIPNTFMDIGNCSSELEAEIQRLKTENSDLKSHLEKIVATSNDEDVEKLKNDLEHYKSMYETCYDQVKRYEEELGPVEKLDDWKEQLSIKERIIFFQALTGCSLKGVDKKVKQASQLAKAKLIARFSGNSPSKIRSVINQLYKEIEEVETQKRKDFSQGTKDAALNVRNYLHLAVEGVTIGNKPHQCNIAMQTIDQIYHFKIHRATPPPKDEDFLIEREPQDQ